jgi:hypothetical protein
VRHGLLALRHVGLAGDDRVRHSLDRLVRQTPPRTASAIQLDALAGARIVTA